MSIFYNRTVINAVKLYVCAALIITAIFSGPVIAVAAILVLLAYLFVQWPHVDVFISLIVNYFVFFALAILISPVTNFFMSNLIALPVLFLVTSGLVNTVVFLPRRITRYSRSLTQIGIMLLFIGVVNLIVALFLGSLALVLATSVAIIYLAILSVISITGLTDRSIAVEQIQERIIAGTTTELEVKLRLKTKIGGVLALVSPYTWLKIYSPVLLFKQDPLILKLLLSPLLSGPSDVFINAYATDCWGLTQLQFQITPVKLIVIPRARYVAWIARRYLDATKPGMLPLISNVCTIRPQFGFRRGIEYYGSQLYQPGDELKSVDWKHSAKYNKMITKEFVEFHGQPVVLLVNLTVSDVEEADELAQKTVFAAISLARQQVPTVIAAYDQYCVKLVTATLQPHQLILQSLEIIKKITISENPARYLFGPDIGRLKANISRLEFVAGNSSQALAQLMSVEYANILNNVTFSPATKAIHKALNKANLQSTFVVVSRLNHDANANQVNRFLFTKKGYAWVIV